MMSAELRRQDSLKRTNMICGRRTAPRTGRRRQRSLFRPPTAAPTHSYGTGSCLISTVVTGERPGLYKSRFQPTGRRQGSSSEADDPHAPSTHIAPSESRLTVPSLYGLGQTVLKDPSSDPHPSPMTTPLRTCGLAASSWTELST
jgi:hypothetical protein